MALEHLLSYAEATGLDADEVKVKVRDKLRSDFLRGVCYEYLTTYLDATGLNLMDDLKLSEDEVQRWYENYSNLWHAKEMEKLTGVWPKQECIDGVFYMTKEMAEKGMDLWRVYINHLGVKPSFEKTMEAYQFVLGDENPWDYGALREITELTGVDIPEDLVQRKYSSIIKDVFSEGTEGFHIWNRMSSASARMKKLFDVTGINANISEELVQEAYHRLLSDKLYLNVETMETLYEVTNMKYDVPEAEAQKIIKSLLLKGDAEHIVVLKKILQTEPEFSYEEVQEAYSTALGNCFDVTKRIRAIKDFTDVKPSEMVAIEGYTRHKSCCFSGYTTFASAWKEISGVGIPEEVAHKYLDSLLNRNF
mgnify:CR=1 FL=1